jgi:hypothetical protein
LRIPSINVIIWSVIFVPPFFGFDTFMEAQDDYFVNLFTSLYKILSLTSRVVFLYSILIYIIINRRY